MSKVPADAKYVITPKGIYSRDMEIPEGFEYASFDIPSVDETFLNMAGTPVKMQGMGVVKQDGPRIIVRSKPAKCQHCGSESGIEPTTNAVRKFCGSCGGDLRRPATVLAKPRRWIIEDSEGGFFVRPGTPNLHGLQDCRLIREVKPITRDEIAAATAKTINQYMGGSYNQAWARLLLRELGIEVED